MKGHAVCGVLHVAIGIVIATLVLQAFFVLGWIVPVTVSGSSMAPTLLGPHREYRCPDCRCEFAVGLDQLPSGDTAICPDCGRPAAAAVAGSDRPGEHLTVDRNSFVWRGPRRWETIVFRCPHDASQFCVKRVVGLPGETISLDGGDIVVNGQIVQKSLAEQRSMRQVVSAADDESDAQRVRVGNIWIAASPRWQLAESGVLEYRHLGDRPITDELNYNQGSTPPVNQVADIMLTFAARLAGSGRLTLAATNRYGRFEFVADFELPQVALRINDRLAARRPLPASAATGVEFDEWTFSLFDRHVLLVIGDQVVLAEPFESGRSPDSKAGPSLAIGVSGMTGEIRSLAVWRDVYYAVRHGDGRQAGVNRGPRTNWRLGPTEYFVVGDNAAISEDSRSWLSGPGIDAKLFIGKPLGVR